MRAGEPYLIEPHHRNESTNGASTRRSKRACESLRTQSSRDILGRAVAVQFQSIDPSVGVQLNAYLRAYRRAGDRFEVDRRFMLVEVRMEVHIRKRRVVTEQMRLGQIYRFLGNLR